MKLVAILSCVLLVCSLSGQTTYPQDYFRAPVKSALLLSGTFAELRPNHFHAGIDIKGSVGVPLYAAADGYVSRVKVSSGGYGNVLYIDHPNGYTTVYAHLQVFAPEVAAYVKRIQHSRESFEIDEYPEAGQLFFKKGDQIGKMGVSGRSFGPHLHFEIRDTKTEKPINPLLFGLQVKDRTKPRMHALRIYDLYAKQEVAGARSYNLVRKGNGYGVSGDTIRVGSNWAGVGIKTYDHMDGVRNWNGIYTLTMTVDDERVYQFAAESFSFDESRYLNAHLDYEEQTTKKSYFHRCFLLPGNGLDMYPQLSNRGVIRINDQRARKVQIEATDVAGNTTHIRFWLKPGASRPFDPPVHNYVLPYDEASIVETGSLFLHFEPGTFYEDLYLNYDSHADPAANVYSWVHQIHEPSTPVHKYFTIAILPTTLPEALRDKAIVVYCSKENDLLSYGGDWVDGRLQAQVRSLGDYRIMVDETPPTIEVVSFKSALRATGNFSFKITDNFATGGQAGELTYRATIDGQWILMEHDAKKDRITYRGDGTLARGAHQFRLVVTDAVGNEQIFERAFKIL